MTTATNRPNVAGNVGRVGAVIAIAIALCALSAAAQTAKEVKGATPLVAVPNEAPPKLVVVGWRLESSIGCGVESAATPAEVRTTALMAAETAPSGRRSDPYHI